MGGVAAVLLVGGEKSFAGDESADRLLTAEPPGLDADPSEVLHRIAALPDFPIENASDALLADDKIAGAEVSVHYSVARLGWRLLGGPTQTQLERRQSKAVIVSDHALDGDVLGGREPFEKRHIPCWDAINGGEDGPAFGGLRVAG